MAVIDKKTVLLLLLLIFLLTVFSTLTALTVSLDRVTVQQQPVLQEKPSQGVIQLEIVKMPEVT